jgi:TRAP-type uncharacterized transport system fused permease subunit
VTGFINRMGAFLLDLGAWNIVAMIFMAYVFGWLLGAGLPPTATYIIGAVVIVPPMTKLGVNPWVAHFFVFFLSVWGELSPPTSLAAAVSARIANASFMRTMWEALKICLPITLMTFAIFTRSDLVINPGWGQIRDVLLVTIGTCGLALAMFGRVMPRLALDIPVRIAIAGLALLVLFHPSDTFALILSPFALVVLVIGIWRHGIVVEPATLHEPPEEAQSKGDLAALVAEAKRDL